MKIFAQTSTETIKSDIIAAYQEGANWAIDVSLWLMAFIAVAALLNFFLSQFRGK